MSINWGEVIGTAVGVGGFTVTWLTLRYSRRDKASETSDNHVKQLVRDEMAPALMPIRDLQGIHSSRLVQIQGAVDRIEEAVKSQASDYRNMLEKVAVVQTQVQFALDSSGQLAIGLAKNMAQILHQPDKSREPIDRLLESFMEGTLTADERVQLKKVLVDIKNWLPGKDLGYPVQPWEPTAAGTFLSILDLVEPVKLATTGHAMHRGRNGGTTTTTTVTTTQEEGK